MRLPTAFETKRKKGGSKLPPPFHFFLVRQTPGSVHPISIGGNGTCQHCAGTIKIVPNVVHFLPAGEILRAIEGSVAPIPCLGSETNECPMSDQCFTLPFWAGLDDVINQYIDSVTLEQLAQSLSSANDGCCGCNSKN